MTKMLVAMLKIFLDDKKLKAHDEKTILGLIFIIVFLVIGLVYLDISRKFGKIRQAQNDNVEITLVHNKKSMS